MLRARRDHGLHDRLFGGGLSAIIHSLSVGSVGSGGGGSSGGKQYSKTSHVLNSLIIILEYAQFF